MPMRKQPKSLQQMCFYKVACNALNACGRSNGQQEEDIRQYVLGIPPLLANVYVKEILKHCEWWDDHVDISSAFHPKCTEIIIEPEDELSYDSYEKLYANLHVMSDLAIFKPVWKGMPDMVDVLDIPILEHPLPNLINLRSVQIALDSLPDLDSSPELFQQMVENCPLLEEINIVDTSYRAGDYCQVILNSECKNLKKLSIEGVRPNVAVDLLEHLPNLEIFRIYDMAKVLPRLKKSYPLKDFVLTLEVDQVASLHTLADHFPHLERLYLETCWEMDLSPLNGLAHLKDLAIRDTSASSILCLKDKCFASLTKLHLQNVIDLNFLFKQDLSLPLIQDLTIYLCDGINTAAIGDIFPNLKSLTLWRGGFTALPANVTCDTAFQKVENVTLCPGMNSKDHVLYLMSCCKKLKDLHLCSNGGESSACEVLRSSTLKGLRKLRVRDNNMKKEVISIIFESCGDDLSWVELESHRPVLSSAERSELADRLEAYGMYFSIDTSSTRDSFKYNPHY